MGLAKVPQARVARAPVAGVTAVGAVVVTVQEMAAAMMGARLAVVEALMVRTKGWSTWRCRWWRW